jgi:hypothetical protein
MTDILEMTPEDYSSNLDAARYHNMQDMIDSLHIAEHCISPVGFKSPEKIMRSRDKFKKKLYTDKNYGLYGEDFFKQDSKKVESDRAKLKAVMNGI